MNIKRITLLLIVFLLHAIFFSLILNLKDSCMLFLTALGILVTIYYAYARFYKNNNIEQQNKFSQNPDLWIKTNQSNYKINLIPVQRESKSNVKNIIKSKYKNLSGGFFTIKEINEISGTNNYFVKPLFGNSFLFRLHRRIRKERKKRYEQAEARKKRKAEKRRKQRKKRNNK